ncbi:type II toxin-antitoxin system RelB family antitoxin [Rugamonas rivuli]|uniref:Stability determinant n=1 Tax=Rugamonas rivuli TaxID=2743358 RepID=A0A843SFS2_9BURK|nr:stability determinant [Rugamonas rivuli]MQA20981.1 stability determinant [Rugamonas rivuli]
MNENPSPTASEFATAEEAEAYDRWFRAKVQRSLDDQRPSAPHEDVMAALRKIIETKRDTNASDPMAN